MREGGEERREEEGEREREGRKEGEREGKRGLGRGGKKEEGGEKEKRERGEREGGGNEGGLILFSFYRGGQAAGRHRDFNIGYEQMFQSSLFCLDEEEHGGERCEPVFAGQLSDSTGHTLSNEDIAGPQ